MIFNFTLSNKDCCDGGGGSRRLGLAYANGGSEIQPQITREKGRLKFPSALTHNFYYQAKAVASAGCYRNSEAKNGNLHRSTQSSRRFPDPNRAEISHIGMKARLMEIADAYSADELMIITITGDYASRMKSYELLAAAFSLDSATRATA